MSIACRPTCRKKYDLCSHKRQEMFTLKNGEGEVCKTIPSAMSPANYTLWLFILSYNSYLWIICASTVSINSFILALSDYWLFYQRLMIIWSLMANIVLVGFCASRGGRWRRCLCHHYEGTNCTVWQCCHTSLTTSMVMTTAYTPRNTSRSGSLTVCSLLYSLS